MADLHDLAPFYVLDALGDAERIEFERHLESCARCRAEIDDLDAGVAVLARSVAEPAPASMRSDVMAAIESEEQRSPADGESAVVPIRPRATTVVASLVAAAAAVAIVFGAGLGPSDPDQQTIDSVLAASDRSVVEIESDVVSFAEVVYVPEDRAGVFVASGLDPVTDDRTYQLWLIGEDGPVSAGVFRPGGDGSARVLLEGDVRPGLTVGLTVEPAGGSAAPTGDILIAQGI